MACPAACPGYQASTMAGRRSAARLTARALPFNRTRTVGLPRAATDSRRSSCTRGRSIVKRSPPRKPSTGTSISSPSSWGMRPRQRTTASDRDALSRASRFSPAVGGLHNRRIIPFVERVAISTRI